MTDTETASEHRGPKILVDSPSGAGHPDADAVILRPPSGGAETRPGPRDPALAIWRLGPDDPPPPGARIVVADSLLAAAETAQDRPDCTVVPRAEVRRAARRYGFDPAQDNSGFKTYQLNPATVAAYEVSEDGTTVTLGEWLRRAAALGFGEIWLYAADAEEAGRGFDCVLLDRARKIAPDALFWISGGGRTAAHVAVIAGRPGLAALVADEATADRLFAASAQAPEPRAAAAPSPASDPAGAPAGAGT